MRHIFISVLMGITLSGCLGCEQVDTGFRGIETSLGKVIGDPLPPGLHWYNPFTGDISEFDVRERTLESTTACFTGDTQNVKVAYSVTYYPDPKQVNAIFSQYGWEWEKSMSFQKAVEGALKDTIGKYKADDLVQSRESVRKASETEIASTFSSRGVIVTQINLANLDFDDAYEQAVEEKVTAIQKAQGEKNKTVQIEEQAKQTIAAAKADAEAMRIKSQALAQNKGLVDFEIAKKWDGKLPEIVMGGSIPLLNLDSIKRAKNE